uniref:Uncharacterized protein n=1 Tax=Picea glauca TaxID=3330 RepID=A0A117NHU1_PICGL|nr:hypothetical protein ABT39_MTgene4242 [Picea glauca]
MDSFLFCAQPHSSSSLVSFLAPRPLFGTRRLTLLDLSCRYSSLNKEPTDFLSR